MAQSDPDSAGSQLSEEPPTRPAPDLTGEPRFRPFVTVLIGAEAGRSHWIDAQGLVFGRSRTAGVTLPEDTVSRKHAEIAFDGKRYLLKDLGSANGTFVNGHRVTHHALEDGDKVGLGSHVVMRFNLGADTSPPPPERDLGRDPVTGAASPGQFEAALVAERTRAERRGTPLTLLFVRIDARPSLVARLGQTAADGVLGQVARLLVSQLRKEDVLARTSDDTLCVVLRELSVAQGRILAERILYRLDQLRPFAGAQGTLATLAPVDASVRAHPKLDDALAQGPRALSQGDEREENCVLKALDLG